MTVALTFSFVSLPEKMVFFAIVNPWCRAPEDERGGLPETLDNAIL